MRAVRNGYLQAARHLWVEYKAASQFAKVWQSYAEAEAARARLIGWQPPTDLDEFMKSSPEAASWRQMERVEIEPWFFHEIGRPGDVPSIFSTLATLAEDNIRRAVQFYGQPDEKAEKTRRPRASSKRKKRNSA